VFTRSFRRSHARRVARERKRAAQARQRALLAGATLGATAVFAANAEAANYIVNSTADDGTGTCSPSPGECTLRDAVNTANGTVDTDTVDLSGVSGTITLTQGVIGVADSGGLSINGPGPGTLTVSGGNAAGIFAIDPGAADASISGLTLTAGSSDTNGGAIVTSAPLTLTNVTITGNTAAGDGGGIAISEAYNVDIAIENSTISGNTAAGDGGGIAISEAYNVDIAIENSTISGNTAAGDGGGIATSKYNVNVNVAIENSTISGNTAAGDGGGIATSGIYNVDVAIESSTISGNTAAGDGGGIATSGKYNDNLAIVNSTVSGNSATNGGGVSLDAVLGAGGSISFDNSTIARNTAASSGGGIYLGQYDSGAGYQSATAAINSTIVAGNTAGGAPNDLFRPTTSTSGGFNDTFSLIENPGNAPLLSSQALITGVDPQLGTLANNGGPTQTMLPSNTSPAIDQGRAQAGLTTDQRGEPRTVNNGKAQPPGGDGTDIGAVELPLIPPEPTPQGPAQPGPTTPASLGIAATIGPATGITSTQAVLHGTITTNGQAVTWHFEYGRNTNYGRNTRSAAISSGQGDVPVSFGINRLKPGTRYHYRLVAVSSSGQRATSRDATFRTPRRATRVRISAPRASALSPGCVVAAGAGEREIPGLAAEATRRRMRLTLRGTIQTRGRRARSAGGTVRVSFTVNLPDGRARGTARARVRGGRWETSLVAPGVNLDPLPPRYLITVRYSGTRTLQAARTRRRVRLGIECASQIPAPPPVTG
jgi:CSLREA domain-containing protein